MTNIKIRNVLSLFDGLSGGRIALDMAGIKYNTYYASEIDIHAIKVSRALYPDTIHLGDVTKIKGKDLPKIDLLLGGSPCQSFSFAGKQLAFDDPRGKLFFEYVRLLKELKPKYFFLENVSMKERHEMVISDYLGVAPIKIDSNLLSAQNRDRNYWTNIYSSRGVFYSLDCEIPQPKDKGLVLRDVLEDHVKEKYYLKHPKFDFTGLDINGKSKCLRSSGHASQSDKHNFDLIVTENYIQLNPNGHKSQQDRIYFDNVKYGSLMAQAKTDRNKILTEKRVRRLSPRECGRLQTIPEHILDIMLNCGVSESQLYKMIGNGWTIEVIAYIFSFLGKSV